MSRERPEIKTLGTTHSCMMGRGMMLCGTKEEVGREIGRIPEECGTMKTKGRKFQMERVSIRIEYW